MLLLAGDVSINARTMVVHLPKALDPDLRITRCCVWLSLARMVAHDLV